jgi:glutamate-1-semialdehyde 2,1-aminomutase
MTKFKIPKSLDYNKLLKTRVPGGVHYSFRIPWESKQIHFVSAQNTRIRDLDDNEYLDFFCKFGANILGHNHPRYNEAIVQALSSVSSSNLGILEYEAADLICSFVPSAEMVRFSLSGTEAVQNALRLARAFTGKEKFIRFVGHYHGNADNIMGGTVGDLNYPVPVEFNGDLYDTAGKPRNILRDQSFLLPWDNLEVLEAVMEKHHTEIAAVIMEPLCINGGGISASNEYLISVRQLCDRLHVVLIFDEIITGFRAGLGGVQAIAGVTPDLTTLGKAMAGGSFPVSAIAGKKEIMQLYEVRKVVHGGTFNGYPLGIAAVKSTLEILSADNGKAYETMNNRMEEIYTAFTITAEEFGFSFEMKGMKSCAVYHQINNKPDATQKERMIAQYINKMIGESLTEHGILLSNANRFYGNISIQPEDIALFKQRIPAVFESVAAFVHKMAG